MSEITCTDVSKLYDPKGNSILAVDEVSLTIRDGEFLTIVGPSGSGKSTLLRMIAGLEDITDGEIRIGDRVVNDVPPQRRDVAMVFQNYALYPHMSVQKNMSYGLKLTTDLSTEEINQRVEETAEMMGIGDQLEKKPGSLSGGQQQRVATGRAIVRDPEVFLFDEPLSNLDAKLRMSMRTELQRLQEDLETTSVYVTHDQTEAMTMSDRIVIFDEGEIQQVGTPEEVYANPTNRFVADFIGSPSMNFATVEMEGNVLIGADFEYRVSDRIADRVREGDGGAELELGIRPEDVTVEAEPGDNRIPVTLDVVEHEGSDNYLYLVSEDVEWTVRVPGDRRPEEGSRLHLEFPESELHVFDRASGENLLAEETTEKPTAVTDGGRSAEE
ncbi:sugar ABC transporter ATP-binding protein [Natronococcus pandeyae]|uniref:ABC-type D-xylose/L-arabinose transporter n=1 Tax=Natronococcus pandeyae TaxID=2055836 RepID=A0A8J8TRK5_9EURY|nr:sn-glycerol-3-phosphate ABC transporter ATP-binding protein UgpC [Natronococcus pandeyae]TYL37809.1 sugar ABC transporter ATP-binding protein [Natronococcus pandeyae]